MNSIQTDSGATSVCKEVSAESKSAQAFVFVLLLTEGQSLRFIATSRQPCARLMEYIFQCEFWKMFNTKLSENIFGP